MVTAVSVLPLNSQVLPGHNQETYQRLQAAVQMTPPHQIWLATCDDLPLQRRLAATLEESIQPPDATIDTQRLLDIQQPNLVQQLQRWLLQSSTGLPPLFQILGIEQLTNCSSDTQYQFLRSLHQLQPLWPQFKVSILLWMPRPWLKQIRREVPNLSRWVFEFMGEPTPITAIAHQPDFQVAFSTVREWQFLGQEPPVDSPVPHSPPTDPPAVATPPVPPAASTPAPSKVNDDANNLDLSAFTETLWHQLQDDLSDFESSSENAGLSEAEVQTAEVMTETAEPQLPPTELPKPAELPSEVVRDERSQSVMPPPAAASVLTEGPSDVVAPPPVDQHRLPDWALAFELRDRVQSGAHSAPTLETAIQVYESLQPEQPAIPQRTEVLNDLGSRYWLWAQQSTAIEEYFQRLTKSSEIYETALSPISDQTAPDVLNRLHSNLGSVYSLLATHQAPSHYLDQAVRAFHRALQYAPVETMPEEYTLLQTHLGTAYWSLSQHSQEATHLHRAIAAYQEALQQAQPQPVPQLYAQLQNNLGIALWSLARHERPVFLLEQAIGAYRTALAYRTREADKLGYAATQNNLGTAYWDLGGHREANSPAQQQAWRQAIIAYEAAIATVEPTPDAPLVLIYGQPTIVLGSSTTS